MNRTATAALTWASRKRKKQVMSVNRRSSWISRLLALTVIAALILPVPAQAWAQAQQNERAAALRLQRWFDSFAPSATDPANEPPPYALAPPQQSLRAAASASEILPVPLLPKAVELVSGRGANLDPWQLFDGKPTTALGLTSSEPVSFGVELQEPRALAAITVLGPTEGTFSVFAREGSDLNPIQSLQGIHIHVGANEWQRVSVDDPGKVSRLVIKWTPASLAAPSEIGLWGRWLPPRDATDAQLADRILANAAPGVLVANATPERVTAARVVLGASGPQDGVVHVQLPADPRSWSHAFLVYELTGLGHFTEVVRQINGSTPQGGAVPARGGGGAVEGGLQVEEISPEWLKLGNNEIRFLPLREAGAPDYSVQRVRILGTGHASLYEARMADAQASASASVQRFAFAGASQAHDLVFELLEPSKGHVSVRATGAKAGGAQRIDLDGLDPGWHRVNLDALPKNTKALEVVLDKAAGGGQTRREGYLPKVSEVVVTASSVASDSAGQGVAISYPLHGECRNREAWVTGFVAPQNGEEVVRLRANGQDVTAALALDKSFALKLPQPFGKQNKPWSTAIEATLSSGKSLRRTVNLAPCVDDAAVANKSTTEDVGAPYAQLVRAGEKQTLAFAGAKLEIPAGAVDHDVRITIRPLVADQVHDTGPRVTNTSPGRRGFRFGPHGLKFKKPVKLSLPYDAAALKQGETERDLFAFYYDEPLGSWQRIGRYDTARAGVLTSLSEHFTDFVTGTLAAPDEPGVKSFSSNEMKNIKVGDPGAGVEFIAPPAASSSGSMNLSYPIEVPPGRNGIEPRLAFTYSSEKTNGWLGVGWDLRVPAVEIDTRFGVPRYDEVNYSRDSYLIDGEQIVASPANSDTYVRRVEGAFETIVRNVDSNQCVTSWTVTDKHGTVSTFGGPGAVLAQPGTPCNVFRWGLSSVQDTFGNRMTIGYVTDPPAGSSSGSADPYVELYPAQIDYTSHVGTGLAAAYRVLFARDSGTERPDVIITGRPGFQERTRYRLHHVDVQLLNGTATPTLIRRYALTYQPPTLEHFYKSVLASVGQQGLGAAYQLDQHTFEYGGAETLPNVRENKPGVRGFGAQQQWGTVQNGSALSRVDDEMSGGGVTLGVGFPVISFSVNGGGNAGSEKTLLSLLDLNGDGLPDFGANGTGYMNFLRPNPATTHLQAQSVSGLDSLGRTEKSGWSVGGNLSVFGVGPSASYTRSSTDDKEIITDIDGDGYPDRAWVANDQLRWARNNGNNQFINMPAGGTVLQNSTEVDQDFVSAGAQGGGLVRINPVVRWNAPFGANQSVTIQGAIQKLVAGGNGVDLAIYRNSTLLWSNSVGPSDLSSCVPNGAAASNNSGCGNGLHTTVSAGDSLYFLTSPHHDPNGPQSQLGLESISNQISWSPQVSYDSRPTPNDVVEPYNMPVHVFSQGDDFRLFRPEVQWVASADGTVHVQSNRTWLGEAASPKGSTSDELTFRIVRHPKGTTTEDVRFQQTYPPDAGTAIAFDTTIGLSAGDAITLEVKSPTTIDFDQLHLAPSITYTNYCRRISTTDVPYCADVHYIAGPPLLGALDNDPEADSPVSIDLLTQRLQVSYPFRNYFGETSAATVPAAASTTANGTISFSTTHTDSGLVLIQGVNQRYYTHVISAYDDGMGGPGFGSLSLSNEALTNVQAGQLMVTVYGPPGSSASGTVTVGGVSIPVTSKALDPDFDQQDMDGLPVDPMSGGFHLWASGFMNGDLAGGFNPANIVFPLDPTAHARHNPTWFFFGVPQHDDDPNPNPHLSESWQGPGGSFIRAGVFNPSRGSASFSNGGGLGALRHASTWNFDLSVGAVFISAGINQGRTKNDHEFFDLNGDRFPDAISADGTVQYGDGAGGFKWTQQVTNLGSLPALRRVDHGTLHASASVGDVKLISDTATDGSINKTITTGFAFGTDYGLSTTNVDWLDVNGDGLPDAVERNDDSAGKDVDHPFSVRLNYGYRLGPAVSWPARTWKSGSTESATGVIGTLAAKTIGADNVGELINTLSGFGTSVGINGVRAQDTSSNNVNVGLAGGTGGIEISGGAGFSFGVSRTLVDMIDVNADGLPDQVIRVRGEDVNGDSQSLVLRVRLNLGSGFALEDTFFTVPKWAGVESSNPFDFAGDVNDSLGFRRSKSYNESFSFKVCFFVCFGASGFHESGSGWAHSNFEDIDGDGRADMVFKSKDGSTVYTKLNTLPKELNLLTKVNRPLGGSFQVQYARAGNLVNKSLQIPKDAPSNKYVMTRLDVSDGQTPVPNHYVKTFDYDEAGFHDRVEREDYGFAKVTTSRLNSDGTLYAKTEVTYNNQDFYRKGLVAKSVDRDAQDKVFDVQKYTYAASGWGACSAPTGARTGSAFPGEATRMIGYFEGLSGTNPDATPLVSTSQSRTWDCVGNLTDMLDSGDQSANNDIRYRIEYADNLVSKKIFRAGRVTATDHFNKVLRDRRATYDARGALLTFNKIVVGGVDPITGLPNTGDPATNPTWTYTYDALGNVSKVVDPRGYTVNYLYDPTTQTYRTQASDSFGYASSSVPDLRFGAVASQTDANGSLQNFSYDDFGRLKWVDGPYDVGTNNHTISFAYSEVGVPVTSGSVVANNPIPAYSITYHKDAQHPTQPIVTSTFADGLARPIQTKKSHVRDTGSGAQVGMLVSGDVSYDGQGRIAKQMQPFFDTQAPEVKVTQPAQSKPAMTSDYDVLDRGTLSRTSLAVNPGSPDGYDWATSKTSYGVGQINGVNRLSSTVLDANVSASTAAAPLPGYQRQELHGVRGDVLKVVEQNRLAGSATPTTLTTAYGYNAFSELLSVTDAKGNVTRVTYDTVGRIVTLVSPDAGRIDYQFDLSGNLAAKQTSNLSPGFQLIRYEYDFNRLKKIDYPNSADVTYEYGAYTDAGPIGLNRATRLKRETSEAGVKEYEYDALGNVNEETWTLNQVGSTSTTARTLAYDYDSFGRLLKVYYPGVSAEVVSYGYDAGGNLDTVTGVTKTGSTTKYVQHIGYDEFGARSLVTFGNGITTKYTYDPTSRRLTGINASERDPALVQANKPARPFQQVSYQYDPLGNVTQIANTAPVDATQTGSVKVGPATENFSYDDLYQLKTADGLQQTSATNRYHYGASMTYDSINNVVQKSQLSETQTLSGSTVTQTTTRTDQTYTSAYVYPIGGRPHAPSEVNDTVPGSSTPVKRSFVYDKSGNQSSWQRTTGTPLTRTVKYSDDNRATQVTQGGVTLQEALYDGSGQRLVKRANGSSQTAYFGQYVTVRDALPTTKHIFAGGMRVASKFVPNDSNEECANCPDRASVTYFHGDQLGSTTFASDELQNLVAHEQYFPSGELWVDQTNDTAHGRQPYLWQGKELDVETGLYYFGARYYDPRLGLWTTPDPILDSYLTGTPNRGVFSPQNLNLYSYTWNNPVSHSDQSGLFLDTFVDVAFVALDVLLLCKDEAETGGANRAMNVAHSRSTWPWCSCRSRPAVVQQSEPVVTFFKQRSRRPAPRCTRRRRKNAPP